MASSPDTKPCILDLAMPRGTGPAARQTVTAREASTAAALESLPVFRSMGGSLCLELARIGRIRRVPDGSSILLAADRASLFAVLAGCVAADMELSPVDIGPADYYPAPAAIFTGKALVDGPSKMSLTARSEVTVLQWPVGQLLPLIQRYPELALHLAAVLGEMAVRAMTSATDSQLPTAERRCAAALLRLSGHCRELPLTRSELGRLVGVSRSPASSILAALEQIEAVGLGYRQITVLNRSALALIRDGTLSLLHAG